MHSSRYVSSSLCTPSPPSTEEQPPPSRFAERRNTEGGALLWTLIDAADPWALAETSMAFSPGSPPRPLPHKAPIHPRAPLSTGCLFCGGPADLLTTCLNSLNPSLLSRRAAFQPHLQRTRTPVSLCSSHFHLS